MEMDFFAQFRVREGLEGEAESALREVLPPTRLEAGCVRIEAYRELRGDRVFYIHSKWKEEAAFEDHVKLPHTVRFLQRMKELLEREPEMTRTEKIEEAANTSSRK